MAPIIPARKETLFARDTKSLLRGEINALGMIAEDELNMAYISQAVNMVYFCECWCAVLV